MSVLVVGMSHRSAPVSLLERLSVDENSRGDALVQLVERPSLSEALILSTCNRFEVYVVTSGFHNGVAEVMDVLQGMCGVESQELRGYLYVRFADAAAEHMMLVTSGLDSMVTGEQQIIGQMRSAYQQAGDKATVGPELHALVQAALHTGKRVHSETDIDALGGSMVSFALGQASQALGANSHKAGAGSPFAGLRVMVLGAGAMASLAATHLGKLGVAELVLANRTRERAERLADHAEQAGVRARVVDFEDRARHYGYVDVVVSATGAQGFTVTRGDVRGQQLLLVDLSLPRDVDPSVVEEPGVDVINIEGLSEVSGSERPSLESHSAMDIVREELRAFCTAQRVKGVAPAVSALREHAYALADAELKRLQQRASDIDDASFAEVEKTVHRVVEKLLHQPMVKVKELAASSGAVSYESALQELFGLSESAPPPRSVSVQADELPDLDELQTRHEA